jgi:ADP-ribose pyrophosphatase
LSGRGAELLDRREVWPGRVVHLHVDRVRFPDGREGEMEWIRHSGAAAILPLLDPLDHPDPRILLIHQLRYSVATRLYEIPAGRPDGPDEPWAVCAARELEEETGWRAGQLHYLTHLFTTPGFSDEAVHLFLATDLSKGVVQRDPDEDIELRVLPLSEALDGIHRGEIVDAKTVVALLHLRVFPMKAGAAVIEAPARKGVEAGDVLKP